MAITFDLSTLNLSAGTHEITVKARASGYEDSPASNAVSYVVAGADTVQVSDTWYFNETISESDLDVAVDFKNANGTIFIGISIRTGSMVFNTSGAIQELAYYSSLGGWQNEDDRTITFDGVQTVSKEFYEWFTANAVEYSCFAEGTQITLADGNTKAVENITYDDDLLVWDFYNGEYATAKPFWIMRPAVATYYYKITLSSGNIVKLVGSNGNCHRVFSVTKNKFEYATKCGGDDIYTEQGVFKMISCERVDEVVKYYNLKTEKYHNCFANNILTCGRHGNMYDIENMKYCSDIPNFTEEELAEREALWEAMRLPR